MFVLNTFSFVFLLKEKEQHHVILETLYSEVANYIWHIEKNNIHTQLNQVNNDLNIIKNNGRHNFLENSPANFSCILHDYSNEKKGFIIWKENLEERLV